MGDGSDHKKRLFALAVEHHDYMLRKAQGHFYNPVGCPGESYVAPKALSEFRFIMRKYTVTTHDYINFLSNNILAGAIGAWV